ncbi:MAG: 4-hydroxy-3-methylbut-2-enyl diphosphate reductase [Prevotella sp.]|nr:4-hydroxy-3-methylbut-2-enyl diphosphate reductase [Prevotella sp.]
MVKIEIDTYSGFCFGVTAAIKKAEEELTRGKALYCLGDIVHNTMECERLCKMGLVGINHEDLKSLQRVKVLLRAHGEPPSTYVTAKENSLEIIDATCPVVLRLQRRIKRNCELFPEAQVVIYGKPGHAEVLGLVGQTEGRAIVVADLEKVKSLDFSKDICLYSQTTQTLDEYRRIIDYIKEHISSSATFRSFDTICRQISSRMPNIRSFALRHDLILFVSDVKSSNGRILFDECREVNKNSYLVEGPSQIESSWLKGIKTVGICGATSTPKWLMEKCRDRVIELLG